MELGVALTCFARAARAQTVNKRGRVSRLIEKPPGALTGVAVEPPPCRKQKPFAFGAVSVNKDVVVGAAVAMASVLVNAVVLQVVRATRLRHEPRPPLVPAQKRQPPVVPVCETGRVVGALLSGRKLIAAEPARPKPIALSARARQLRLSF